MPKSFSCFSAPPGPGESGHGAYELVGDGLIAGAEQQRVPLCGDCLELLLTDAAAFWRAFREWRSGGGA